MQDQFDVAEVQRLLGVPADGELGPVTAAAIAAWKRSRGLRGEGLAPAEYQRLLADVPLLAVRQMERWVGLIEARGDLVLFDWVSSTATLWITWGGWSTDLWMGACGRWTAIPAATVSLPAETVKVALFGHLSGIRDHPPRIGGR